MAYNRRQSPGRGHSRGAGGGGYGPHASNVHLNRLRDYILDMDGPEGLHNFKEVFRQMDRNKDRTLDFFEFLVGLKRYGLNLSRDDTRSMFMAMDRSNSGRVDFDEFMRALGGKMSRTREDMVMETFRKMDKDGSGIITAADISSKYNVSKHPDFRSGRASATDVLERFLNNFEGPSMYPNGEVTLEEFLAYFREISDRVDDDREFEAIIQDAFR